MESLYSQTHDVLLTIGDENFGQGTLTITSTHIEWRQTNPDQGDVRMWKFRDVILHAITNASTQVGIMTQIIDSESGSVFFVFFTPEDPTLVGKLFQEFSEGMRLNPDPEQEEFQGDLQIEDDVEADGVEDGWTEEDFMETDHKNTSQ